MTNHKALTEGSTWRHFKYAIWMRRAGTFTVSQLADHFYIGRSPAWEMCVIALDAGYIEVVGRRPNRGQAVLYRVTSD